MVNQILNRWMDFHQIFMIHLSQTDVELFKFWVNMANAVCLQVEFISILFIYFSL